MAKPATFQGYSSEYTLDCETEAVFLEIAGDIIEPAKKDHGLLVEVALTEHGA